MRGEMGESLQQRRWTCASGGLGPLREESGERLQLGGETPIVYRGLEPLKEETIDSLQQRIGLGSRKGRKDTTAG